MSSARSVEQLIVLFRRWGGDGYDEEIGQLDHALQTAALAVAASADESLVAAALLHDIGHLLDLDSDRVDIDADLRHEDIGPAWLRPLLPVAVTAPIAMHVRAKRYLCAVEPSYAENLSPGSIRSLELQGGPMTDAEIADFERLPRHGDAVRLRRWDDAAKVSGLEVEPIESYIGLLTRLSRP